MSQFPAYRRIFCWLRSVGLLCTATLLIMHLTTSLPMKLPYYSDICSAPELALAFVCLLYLGTRGIPSHVVCANHQGRNTSSIKVDQTQRDDDVEHSDLIQIELDQRKRNDALKRKEKLIQSLTRSLIENDNIILLKDRRIDDLEIRLASGWEMKPEQILFARHKWNTRGKTDLHGIGCFLKSEEGCTKGRYLPIKDIDQFRCSVCISLFEQNDETVNLPCQHRFHEKCVTLWLQQNLSCPRCTRKLLFEPVLREAAP